MRTVVRRTAPRALPRSVMGTSAFVMAPSAVTPFSFTAATQQYRFAAGTFVKNSLAPIGLGPTRETKTPEELREELPSVFDKRPEEIDDYIRPERTYFERLEDLWDWFISFLSPVEKQMQWMRSLHDGALGFDLSWGAIFMLWGAIMRLMSIGPMLYAQRNTLRMARCSSKTTDIQNNIKRVKNDKTLTTPEKRVMTDGYKRMEKAIYAKHKCHKYGSVAGGVTSPIMISAFMAIRRLAAYEDDLESSHFLWVTDLTMPDPTMLLPFICTGLFIFNFEMNQKLNRGGRSSMGMYFRWGLRGGAVFGAWYFSSQPACLFAYWIGMSSMGMLQPYLLRNQKFRDYFEFPPPAKVAMDHSAKSAGPAWAAFLPAFMRPALGVKPEDLTAQATLNKKTVENISEHDIILDDDDDIDPKKTAAAKAAPAAAKRV